MICTLGAISCNEVTGMFKKIVTRQRVDKILIKKLLLEKISPYCVVGDDTNLANVICYKLLLIPQFFRIVCAKVYTKSQIG